MAPHKNQQRLEVLHGTLDLLVLRILDIQPMHGYGLSEHLAQVTDGTFRVNAGSLFPALHKMEQKGWIEGEWGRSENNRRAKFYRLSRTGRAQLAKETATWKRASDAIELVLESEAGSSR